MGVMPPTLKGYSVEPENNEEALCNMMEYAVVRGVSAVLPFLALSSTMQESFAVA